MVAYYQGTFIPQNKEKYCGISPIIFRSSYERKFMSFLDQNPSILRWSSESVIIPYIDVIKKKVARYFPDFYVELIDLNKNLKKYLIEVKPAKDLKRPVSTGKRKLKYLLYEKLTYIKNISKWKFATEYCKKQGWEFKIITEKDLRL